MQDDDISTTTSRCGMIINVSANEDLYRMINEKKNQLNELKHERDGILKLYEDKSFNLVEKYRILSSIDCNKFQLAYLKEEIEKKVDKLNHDKEKLREINRRIVQRNEMMKLYKDKMQKIKELLSRSEKVAHNKLKEYRASSKEIIELEKGKLRQLDKYIFNLTELKPKLNEDENLLKSTFTALKDARMTMYINGRWIMANDQFHYTIVKSKLQSNGDYSAFCRNTLEVDSRDEKKMMPQEQQQLSWLSRNPDHNEIQSALTYTTQFVNLIAFYLNAVLPYNLPHNKFCSQALKENEKKFTNAVAKLNVNIIYLCLYQHIPVTNLLPKHSLENLFYFLNYFNNMEAKAREKYTITYPNEMISLLDEMFVKCDNNDDIDDLDFIPNIPLNDYEEWETLPNSDEIPMDIAVPVDSSNNTKSGLFASTTNFLSSVTSFFSKP